MRLLFGRVRRFTPVKLLNPGGVRWSVKQRWSLFWLIAFPVLLSVPLWSGWLQGNALLWLSGLGSGVGGRLLPGIPTIDPNIGFTSQALGIRAAHDWLSGHIPWWNPFEATGVPLAGEMQSAALFLPWILLLALPSGQLWFHISLEIMAGLGAFLLLRRLGVGVFAATLGGLLFEVNGSFAWLANAVVNPIAFLPWLLLGIESIYRQPGGSARHAVPGGIIVAMALAFSLYAGFPEVAYLDGLLGSAWAVLRFVQLRGGARWRFAGRLSLGGALGILLALPAVLPFLDYLRHAYAGGHNGGFADVHLAYYGLAGAISPYFFGPLGVSWRDWWGGVGGYFGVGLVLAAILGLGGRRERALRLVLGFWVVIGALKAYGQPEITRIINVIPMIKEAAFSRYIWPTWEMALVILAALALDDLRSDTLPRKGVIVAWIGGGVVTVALLVTGWPMVGKLLANPDYVPWLLGSLLLGLGIFMAWGMGVLAGHRPHTGWLAGIVLAEAALFFVLPLFANPRHGEVELGGVRYLQSHLGLQRFYTLGPIQPNYGSAFGIAELNYIDLPIAKSVVRYVHDRLDPYAKKTVFNGNYPRPEGVPSSAKELRTRRSAYAAAGVAYVVTPVKQNPFVRIYPTKVASGGNRPAPLVSGQSLTLTIQDAPRGRIDAIAVFIATYTGTANGPLSVRVCTDGVCARGSRALGQARDNAYFRVPLGSPLDVKAAPLDITFTHTAGNQPMVVWLWPLARGARQALTRPLRTGMGVRLNLEYQTVNSGGRPQRVYRDSVLDIYRLPHPAAYFQASGCRVAAGSRTRATTDCPQPARLIRLETALPGWHATVNGKPVQITEAEGLFQSVPLPAGPSTVRFRYTPRYFALIVTGFWIGVWGLLGWFILPGLRRRIGAKRQPPAS